MFTAKLQVLTNAKFCHDDFEEHPLVVHCLYILNKTQ